jgi:Reverse transcriptase (RNA-dependent DNA polymerase)
LVTENGWSQSELDAAVFVKKWDNGDWAMAGFWVDDETGVGSEGRLLELEEMVAKRYGVSSAGPVNWMLGMTVERDVKEHTVQLGQEAYIDSLLERFGLVDAKTVSTPLPVGADLAKANCPKTPEEQAEMADSRYRELVGCLMYSMLTVHPEIAYAVSVLSKFVANPGPIHYEAAKRVLRYLKGVKSAKLVLGGWAELRAYSDADWAGDRDDRRSTGAYVFCIGAGAVSWSSKRQPTVALSTLEAEYMALTQAAKEALWLKRFLAELGIDIPSVILFGDNQGSLALAKNNVFHARSKHIDIQHHFIRDTIKSGDITLQYLPTQYMVADVLTKSLPTEKHHEHARAMGLSLPDLLS